MVTEFFTKPELKKGSNYKVRDYPNTDVFWSEYLGFSKEAELHVFKNRDAIMLLDDKLIMDEKGVVGYKPNATQGIVKLTKDAIKKYSREETSRLFEMLKEIGAIAEVK